jgi:hypothetical protein
VTERSRHLPHRSQSLSNQQLPGALARLPHQTPHQPPRCLHSEKPFLAQDFTDPRHPQGGLYLPHQPRPQMEPVTPSNRARGALHQFQDSSSTTAVQCSKHVPQRGGREAPR